MKLTKEETLLISAIRNYRKALHNPSFELEWFAREIFERILIDGEGDDERRKIEQKQAQRKRK